MSLKGSTKRKTLAQLVASLLAGLSPKAFAFNWASKQDHEAIVIGAGLCGLSAARELTKAGVKVTLIEGANRPGGRVWTERGADGHILDRGGQALNSDMKLMLELCQKHGAQLINIEADGRTSGLFADLDAKATERVIAEAEKAVYAFYSGQIKGPFAKDTSLASLLQTLKLDEPTKRFLSSALTEQFAVEPDKVNASDVMRIIKTYRSEQEDWVLKSDIGLGEVARHEAESFGASIIYGKPVRSIRQKDGRVFVTVDGATYEADMAVIAIPPTSARLIDFSGQLSPEQGEALNAYNGGHFIKGQVRYTKAFWQDHGLSGDMVDTEISGLTSASSGHGSEAILSLFVGGQTAARLGVLSVSERRDHILGRLGKAFGPEALTPLSYDETLWMQSALTPGGYNAHLKANGRTDAPFILAKRFGNCVLASSELSTRFSGFTEGACFAGITAAKVLLKG